MIEETTQSEGRNERLKNRVLAAYKKYKVSMKELSDKRAESNDYYMGMPNGKEVEGRSGVISRDLFEIVEGEMPSLMKIFYGGQRIVEVSGQGKDDDLKAKLMEEKINFDFQKLNKGFKILYQFFKDALLHKIGCIKYAWDTTPKWKYHNEYKGVTETYIRDLERGVSGNPHIIDKKVMVNEGGISLEGILIESTYDIQCRERIKQSRPLFINKPLNELSFNIDMKDVEDEDGIIIDRIKIHKRKLSQYGFDIDDIETTIKDFDTRTELESRFSDLGGLQFITDDKDSDFVYLNEASIYDFDEDGNPIPMIVHIVGNQVGKVEVNKYGKPTYCFITPTIIAHRLVGISMFDAAKDIQDISTAFLRIILDSGYYQNIPVSVWNPFAVKNIPEEFVPGTKILTEDDRDPRTVMSHIPTQAIAPQIIQIYSQMLPKIKGRRFGLTDFSAGLDPKALATRTSGGISQLMTSSQEPRELIARCFAETGVRDLFIADMQMNIDFLDTETNIKINEEWTIIKREDINGVFDITVDVGIGTGSKDMIFNQLINMLNIYGGISRSVKDPTAIQQIFTLDNIKNILESAWEMLGFKNAKGRFTANEPNRTGIGQPNPERTAIPGTTGLPNIQGITGRGGQVYPQKMAAMPS